MTQQQQLLYKKLNALRLEVDGSIVDDIKQTVDKLFAPAKLRGAEEFRKFIGDKPINSEWIIISEEYGHRFEIGEKIRIVSVNENDYYATNGKESWYVRDSELTNTGWQQKQRGDKGIEAGVGVSPATLEDFINWFHDNYERENTEFRSNLWIKNEDGLEYTTKEVVAQFITTKMAPTGTK